MIPTLAGASAFVAWLKLVFAHGRFWHGGPQLERRDVTDAALPEVVVIVPARDEAESIQECLTSLLRQDYGGPLSVVLVDDGSVDGTGDLARAVPDPDGRLTVIEGQARPEGWSGKLWAVHQGEMAALKRLRPDGFVLLTDADIVHAPAHIATLVAKAQEDRLDLVSEMVKLNCESAAERWLVPAFVYFFAMLYPFTQVNDPASRIAGAAGARSCCAGRRWSAWGASRCCAAR